MKLQQRTFLLFHFFGLCKNLSIFPIEASCSWMLHRNKLLFRSSTERRLFRVTTQEPSIFQNISLIPEKDQYISMIYVIKYMILQQFSIHRNQENPQRYLLIFSQYHEQDPRIRLVDGTEGDRSGEQLVARKGITCSLNSSFKKGI